MTRFKGRSDWMMFKRKYDSITYPYHPLQTYINEKSPILLKVNDSVAWSVFFKELIWMKRLTRTYFNLCYHGYKIWLSLDKYNFTNISSFAISRCHDLKWPAPIHGSLSLCVFRINLNYSLFWITILSFLWCVWWGWMFSPLLHN